MSFQAIARLVPGTMRTSTGTQDFTSPGVGTPKGVVVVVSWALTLSDTTFRNGAGAAWGCSDGTRHRCMWYGANHNSTTQISGSGGSQTQVVKLLNPNSGALVLEVEWSAWIPDGVRLNVTTTNTNAFQVYVILFGGSGVECYAFDGEGTGAGNKVTTGFLADFALTNRMKRTDGSTEGEGRFDPGIATRLNPTNGVSCTRVLSDSAASTSEALRGKSSQFLTQHVLLNEGIGGSDIFAGETVIDSYVSDGFNLQGFLAGVPEAGPRICGLAVKWPLGVAQSVSEVSPGSTGTQEKTFPGFRTGFVYAASSACQDEDAVQNGAGGGCGAGDFLNQRAVVLTDQNAVSTTNAGSRMSEAVVDTHNGARSTHLMSADLNIRLATGFRWDWTVVNVDPRRYCVLALEYDPNSASVAVQAAPATVTIDAQKVIQVSAAVQAAPATVTIDADKVVQTGIAAQSGAATVTIDADKVVQTGIAAQSGAATVTIDADKVVQTGIAAQSGAATVAVGTQMVATSVLAAQSGAATVTIDADKIRQTTIAIAATPAAVVLDADKISQASVSIASTDATVTIDADKISQASPTVQAGSATVTIDADKISQASPTVQAETANTAISGTVIEQGVVQADVALQAGSATVTIDADKISQAAVALASTATVTIDADKVVQTAPAVQAGTATTAINGTVVQVQVDIAVQAAPASVLVDADKTLQTSPALQAEAAVTVVIGQPIRQTDVAAQAQSAAASIQGTAGNIKSADVAVQAAPASSAVQGRKVVQAAVTVQAAPARGVATDEALRQQVFPTIVLAPKVGSAVSLPPPTVVILEGKTHPSVMGEVTVLFEISRTPILPKLVLAGIAVQAAPATASIVGVVE